MKISLKLGIRYILMIVLLIGVSAGAAGKVADSPETVSPLKVGEQTPKVRLKTVDGKSFDLNAALASKPTVLIFYRGGW